MEIEIHSSASSSLEEKFARLLSFLFHPLLMPTYGFAILFFTDNYISTFTALRLKILILCVTFVFTFLLPAINAFVLLKMGRIKSLQMESNEERVIPYVSTALYYFSLYYLFYNAEFPNIFKILVLGASVSIVLSFLVNFKWKISIHMIGIGGIAGGVLGIIYRLHIDLHFILMMVIMLSGLVGYARLKLDTHTPAQVYSGFLLGFFVELSLMIFY